MYWWKYCCVGYMKFSGLVNRIFIDRSPMSLLGLRLLSTLRLISSRLKLSPANTWGNPKRHIITEEIVGSATLGSRPGGLVVERCLTLLKLSDLKWSLSILTTSYPSDPHWVCSVLKSGLLPSILALHSRSSIWSSISAPYLNLFDQSPNIPFRPWTGTASA